MTTLIFGKDGQVGRALQDLMRHLPDVVFLGRQACDLSDPRALQVVLEQHQPKIIINASAYTAVDRAQSEPAIARAINTDAPRLMARYIASQEHGVLVHYSTDYVFGDTHPVPRAYVETDATGPTDRLGVYGQSKLAGEVGIQQAFEHGSSSRYYILRTSWVYGAGNNFIRTMLRVAAQRDLLKVVDDQYGVPTSAVWLAFLAAQFIQHQAASGIYHAVPHGQTNWHQLAVLAIQTARRLGYPIKVLDENILAIPAVQYPLPAPRPYNSLLNNDKLQDFLSQLPYPQLIPHWDHEVIQYVEFITSLKESL